MRGRHIKWFAKRLLISMRGFAERADSFCVEGDVVVINIERFGRSAPKTKAEGKISEPADDIVRRAGDLGNKDRVIDQCSIHPSGCVIGMVVEFPFETKPAVDGNDAAVMIILPVAMRSQFSVAQLP